MKVIKEGKGLENIWTGKCYVCDSEIECTTSEVDMIFSPYYGEELSSEGETPCPVCKKGTVKLKRNK